MRNFSARHSARAYQYNGSVTIRHQTTIESSPTRWRGNTLVLASLIVLTFVAFLPVLHCDFINYDDGKIISTNPHVRAGLTESSLVWAWTTLDLGYVQPVTLTSFMLDVDLFGIDHPGGFHATNLAIHVLNVVLLYLLLASATGSRYRPALVAAIFAVHPLQVESVAWVSERKGLLATFFALLSMMAYLRYARAPGRPWHGRRLVALGMSLIFLTLSLLSKPVFVVFPVLVLLADVWPLRRFSFARTLPLLASQIYPPASKISKSTSRHPEEALPTKDLAGNRDTIGHGKVLRRQSLLSTTRLVLARFDLFLEKIPYVIVIAPIIVLGIYGQRALGSAVGASTSPLLARLAGAVIVCARTVWKAVGCIHLALPYPEPQSWPAAQVIASLVLLITITGVSIWKFRQAPWLLTSWLAFLALLTPITGIIPFGGHRFADRYSYVPLVCLAVMVLWSIPTARVPQWSAFAARRRNSAAGAPTGGLQVRDSAGEGTGGTVPEKFVRSVREMDLFLYRVSPALFLSLLATLTFLQSRHWRDSFTLFNHTLRVTRDNATAYTLLGNAYLQRDKPGDVRTALDNFEQALAIDPDDQAANLDAGVALRKLGRPSDAISHLRKAADFNPGTSDGLAARLALGDVLLDQGEIDGAIAQYHLALQIAPDFAKAHCNLGMALGKQGHLEEAIAELTKAINENPGLPEAHRYLGTALLFQGRADRAVFAFQTALSLNPNSPEGWYGLGDACAALHDWDHAVLAYQRALELRPDYAAARKRLQEVSARRKSE